MHLTHYTHTVQPNVSQLQSLSYEMSRLSCVLPQFRQPQLPGMPSASTSRQIIFRSSSTLLGLFESAVCLVVICRMSYGYLVPDTFFENKKKSSDKIFNFLFSVIFTNLLSTQQNNNVLSQIYLRIREVCLLRLWNLTKT
jgi:hypothetical protein